MENDTLKSNTSGNSMSPNPFKLNTSNGSKNSDSVQILQTTINNIINRKKRAQYPSSPSSKNFKRLQLISSSSHNTSNLMSPKNIVTDNNTGQMASIPTKQLLAIREHIKAAEEALQNASKLESAAKRTPFLEARIYQLESQLSTTIAELENAKNQLTSYHTLSKKRANSSPTRRIERSTFRISKENKNPSPTSQNYSSDCSPSKASDSPLNESLCVDVSSAPKFSDLRKQFEQLIVKNSRPTTPIEENVSLVSSASTRKSSFVISPIPRPRSAFSFKEELTIKLSPNPTQATQTTPPIRRRSILPKTTKTSKTQTEKSHQTHAATSMHLDKRKPMLALSISKPYHCIINPEITKTQEQCSQTDELDEHVMHINLNVKESSIEEGFVSISDASPTQENSKTGFERSREIKSSSPIPSILSTISDKNSERSVSSEYDSIDSYDIDHVDQYLKNTAIDGNKVYLMKQWEELAQSRQAKYIQKFVSRMSVNPDSLLLLNDTGDSPMHFAVVHSNFIMLAAILKHYPHSEISTVLFSFNKLGYSPVIIASALLQPSSSNEHEILHKILSFYSPHYMETASKATVENPIARTLLMIAANYGNSAAVEMLLLLGSEINSPDEDGWTALMLAAKHDHSGVVQVLIHNGANEEIANNEGKTAFKIAVEFGNKNVAIKLYNYSQRSFKIK